MAELNKERVAMPEQPADKRITNFDEVALGYTAEMAAKEASRCLNCKNMPCVSGCPVNIRIPEFIKKYAKTTLRARIKLSNRQVRFLPFAVAFALRKINVKRVAFAE